MTGSYKRTQGWDWRVPLLWVLVLILLLLTDSVFPLGNMGNCSQFSILLLFPDVWDWKSRENLQQADTAAVISQPNTPMHAPVLANISPSAAILHLWSLNNEGEIPYELKCVFQPVQSALKINPMQKI